MGRDVEHAGSSEPWTLPHLKGVAAGPVLSTDPPWTASESIGGTSLMRLPSVGFGFERLLMFLTGGWFLRFFGPGVLQRDCPVEDGAIRRAVFVQYEVAEAFKLIPGFASRFPQAWLAFGRNYFE